jgi:hypothetical protein
MGSGTIPISARAVARGASVNGASGMPGILLLGKSGTTLTGVGNGNVDVTDPKGYTGNGGSIYVDSIGPSAVSMKGNADVTAPSVYIAQTGSAPSGVTATGGSINMGATQLADPMSYLPAPDGSSAPSGINIVNLPSGITGTTNLASNTVYIVGGSGIRLSGQETLTGTNVMLYIQSGTVDLSGQGAVNISPMTTGPYQGISIFQARSDTTGLNLVGNGNLNITGTIYAAGANVTAKGNGTTDVFGSQIIADSMSLTGNGTVNVNFDTAGASGVPNTRNLTLVE